MPLAFFSIVGTQEMMVNVDLATQQVKISLHSPDVICKYIL